MKINNKLLKINHSEILNKPLYYRGWDTSITFDIPIGRQALVCVNAMALIMVWNPADTFHTVFIYGNSTGFTTTRASNNTTITISRNGNASWSVYVFI